MTFAELLPFVLIGGVFWLFVVRPGKKRRDQHNQMMTTLAPGTRIMTTAGLFGTVVEVDRAQVSVEIAPGVVVQMLSQAIANVVAPEDAAADPLDALEADLAALPPADVDAEAPPQDPPARLTPRDGEPDQGVARG